jgi:Fe-S-cluster containining protein
VADQPGAPDGSVGTAPLAAPVTREELERALRRSALAVESVRDDVIQLAAQVVALANEVTRRLDGVEPHPAAPGTPAPPATATVEAAVDDATPQVLERIRMADDRSTARLALGDAEDKYAAAPDGPDCAELLPLCQARCCSFHFPLSTQDLDEGVIRWDYGRPYLIRQRPDDGYCVHNHPSGRFCTTYQHRPRPCRQYDCREDPRIWADFAARIPAAADPFARKEGPAPGELDLVERVRARQVALAMEAFSLNTNESARRRVEAAELAALRARLAAPPDDPA